MDTQYLIKELKKHNEHNFLIKKYTLIVNDRSETQGALFFIPINNKEYKVLIPSPFHLELINGENKPTHLKILLHKEAFILQ